MHFYDYEKAIIRKSYEGNFKRIDNIILQSQLERSFDANILDQYLRTYYGNDGVEVSIECLDFKIPHVFDVITKLKFDNTHEQLRCRGSTFVVQNDEILRLPLVGTTIDGYFFDITINFTVSGILFNGPFSHKTHKSIEEELEII